MESSEPLYIDLKSVVKSKLGSRSWLVPGFVVRKLEKTICADRLNWLLKHNHPKTGADFCRGVFDDLHVTIEASGVENLPDPSHRRVMIVSNHPLGGLDGMALIDFFSNYFGGTVYFIVNDLLMAVKPLNDVFVPINKHGSQSREASFRLESILNGDDPVIIFPAGLVSRLGDDGVIKDLEWKKMFVNKAISTRRDIIPVHFSGHNSQFFYKFARRRKRLGIKFNFEMLYLPSEVFKSEGKTFRITCGKTIEWQSLKGGKEALETAAKIKDIVYGLQPE
ncbi:MAG: 1-acyl-sn-glycerol-3-phosphate acyltransferase [Muribaculaceae bacterium]|nr:1-acyl-sn-glycerol-3-phosphate acyltransferase [Muribaculaceae bacterium]